MTDEGYQIAGTAVYQAADGFEEQLAQEIGKNHKRYGPLFLSSEPAIESMWALNTWVDPVWVPIDSVGDAAKKLTALQRNWVSYPYDFHRRTALIHENLPYVSRKPRRFPCDLPETVLGGFTLTSADMMLVSDA